MSDSLQLTLKQKIHPQCTWILHRNSVPIQHHSARATWVLSKSLQQTHSPNSPTYHALRPFLAPSIPSLLPIPPMMTAFAMKSTCEPSHTLSLAKLLARSKRHAPPTCALQHPPPTSPPSPPLPSPASHSLWPHASLTSPTSVNPRMPPPHPTHSASPIPSTLPSHRPHHFLNPPR